MSREDARAGVRRLFRLQSRNTARIDDDADDELASFVDARVADLRAHGMTANDARSEALRRLGKGTIEEVRVVLRQSANQRERRAFLREGVDDIRTDVRVTARVFWRERGYVLVIALTLALGIASASATFAAVNQILLRPLPVRDQERLAVLTVQNAALVDHHVGITYGLLADFRSRSHEALSVAGVPAALAAAPYAVRDDNRIVQLTVTATTGNFFQVLGAIPQQGRLLDSTDDAGANGPAAVLSYSAWQKTFGGRADIIGHQISLNIGSLSIVGIAPRGFEYPRGTDVWLSDPEYLRLAGAAAGPEDGYWDVLVRLKSGGTIIDASRELLDVVKVSSARLLGQHGTRRIAAQSFTDAVVGSERDALLLFTAAVALVLVVVCTNVAGLMLARGLARTREIAVRKALGATAKRIVRQLMLENIVLAALGGVLGVIGARLLLAAMAGLAPPDLARLDEVHLDLTVVGFTALLALLTAVAFGLAPALSTARAGLGLQLRAEGRAQTGGVRTVRIRQWLVVSQVALGVVMLTSAGLLVRNLARLQRLDLGFDTSHLLFVFVEQVDASNGGDFQAGTARHTAVMQGLVDRLRTMPGIVNATTADALPFSVVVGTGGLDVHFGLEGQSYSRGMTSPKAGFTTTSAEYFATLRIPLLRGRTFSSSDNLSAPRVAIVSEAFARQAWHGQDPMGRQVRFLNDGAVGLWRSVVGVVADTRYHDFLSVRPEVYIPVYQTEPGTFIAVRTTGEPFAEVPIVRDVLRGLDQGYGIAKTVSAHELLDSRLARPRFLAAVVFMLGTTGAILAAIGLFGVLSFSLKQRRQEFGLRLALGASNGHLRSLVVRDVARITSIGLAIGLAIGFVATRILEHEVIDMNTFDPVLLAGVLGTLLVTIAMASALPLARAARVDPVEAMREG